MTRLVNFLRYSACCNSDQNVGKRSPGQWKVALPVVPFWDKKFRKAVKTCRHFSIFVLHCLGFLDVRIGNLRIFRDMFFNFNLSKSFSPALFISTSRSYNNHFICTADSDKGWAFFRAATVLYSWRHSAHVIFL